MKYIMNIFYTNRVLVLNFCLLAGCLAAANVHANQQASPANRTNLQRNNNQGMAQSMSAIIEDASNDNLELKLQLENQSNVQLNTLTECTKADSYQLSEAALYINYLNQVEIRSQSIAKENSDGLNLTLRPDPRKLLSAQYQIMRVSEAMPKLFELYKKYGGTADVSSKVSPLPNPCESYLTEISSNISRQIEIQNSDKKIFKVPKLVFDTCKKPDYPRISLAEEEHGKIRLAFLIDVDGAVDYVLLAKSSGFPLLDTVALSSLRSCHFEPAVFKGSPHKTWMYIDYVFELPL
ncbi:TonB family protein [Oxalobacteraceae bacterium GrIS 2.11]